MELQSLLSRHYCHRPVMTALAVFLKKLSEPCWREMIHLYGIYSSSIATAVEGIVGYDMLQVHTVK